MKHKRVLVDDLGELRDELQEKEELYLEQHGWCLASDVSITLPGGFSLWVKGWKGKLITCPRNIALKMEEWL